MTAEIRNILVIRTDRIGEVLLSTPVLAALREKWPGARISMMVRPEVRGLVEDNPNIDEIMEYDEKQSSAIKLSVALRKKDFGIAVIVNPKKEFHLAAFLAGIPVRVGFDRKWGFLLTHRVKDLKFLAQKHEVEYNLDLVRALGIEPRDKRPHLAVRDNSEHSASEKLKAAMPPGSDACSLIAVHPCTSNPSKQWPKTHFAELGDLLMSHGYNIVMISGAQEQRFAKEVVYMMRGKPADLTGALSLKELAALLKRCRLLISGDSGPVHIAAAVGTPVAALFGKGDPGSRPARWGPYGEGHIVIEKDRLDDISPEDVLKQVLLIVKN
jgi:lipopolysaccharide heptosyltransferase II